MPNRSLEWSLVLVFVLFSSVSCGNGASDQDVGDGEEEVVETSDVEADDVAEVEADGEAAECGNGRVEGVEECDDGNETAGDGCEDDCTFSCHGDAECLDANACDGSETCDIDAHTCREGPAPEDGFVCGDDPRSICVDGACSPSTCGDGFVDGGAGEFCEPPGAGGCSSMCRWLCETNENCPDDGNGCNGEEYCDTGTHECSRRNPLEDGTVCGADPRRLCIAGTCQASTCGDRFTDEVLGEECDDGRDGDPDDGCTDTCDFSCHENPDCEDSNPCTIDICDEADSHACFYAANPLQMLCRPSAGVCDVEELCDGASTACPDDAFLSPTTECRASTAQCDAAELCMGTSADCPVDVLEPPGTACDDGVFCTNPDACDAAGVCVGTPTAWLYGVSAIAAGGAHTCALMSTGGVKCWGYNGYGQLGDGTTTERHTPVDVSGLFSGVSAIAADRDHTCALMNTGGVKCWGRNDYGQLGDGTTVQRLTPVDVSGLSMGISAMAAGWFHTCALMSAGGVKCWGYNGNGQLGDGTTTTRYTPVDVSGLSTGVSAVEAGYTNTCALMGMGGVKCWGENRFGELGDGTTTTRYTPTDVSGLSIGVSAVTTGVQSTCALMSTGGVKCWGYNSNGQLGDGTTTTRFTPVDVSGLSIGGSAVATDAGHTCALMSTGGVRCWGRNDNGQLGDGTTTQRLTPVDVSGLSTGVSAIVTGYWYACALISTGGVKCWGYNSNGQLGDGTTTVGLTPVDVLCQ